MAAWLFIWIFWLIQEVGECADDDKDGCQGLSVFTKEIWHVSYTVAQDYISPQAISAAYIVVALISFRNVQQVRSEERHLFSPYFLRDPMTTHQSLVCTEECLPLPYPD